MPEPEAGWFEEAFEVAGDPVDRARARYLAVERRGLHLWMRVLTRLYLTATPVRRRHGARAWVQCGAGIGVDALVGEWMRRHPDRQGTVWRLPLDLLDLTLWSRHGPDGRFDSGPAVLAVPLLAETTIRVGPARATLCATGLDAVFTGVQWWIGKPVRIRSFRWHAMAILAGIGLRAYADRHFTRIEREREHDLRASWNERYRVGQQHVVDGVDGIGDYLGRLPQWLDEHDKEGRAALIDAAEAVRAIRGGTEGTSHLVTVVKEWVENHREGNRLDGRENWVATAGPLAMVSYIPLAGSGAVVIGQQAGLTKLSWMQRRRLTTEMEARAAEIARRDPEQIVVELAQPPVGPVGSGFTVTVNGIAFLVRDDDDDEASGSLLRLAGDLLPYDPVAVAFILSAGWDLNSIISSGLQVSTVCGTGLGVASAMIGWTIHRRLEEGRAIDPWSVVLASTLFAATGTVLTTRTMRSHLKTDGVQASPSLMELPALVLAINWHQLTPTQRRVAVSIVGATVAAGWLLPRPMASPGYRPNPWHVLLNLLWPLMAVGPAPNFHRSLSGETAQLDALQPVQQTYIEAAAELAGTADLSHDAILLFRKASAEVGPDSSDEEKRLRRLAAFDARRIERHARNLEQAMNDRLTRFQQEMGAGVGTARILASSVHDALIIADRNDRSVVAVDVENTLTDYDPSPEASASAIAELVEWAERNTTRIRKILFLSNSPLLLTVPPQARIELVVLANARKPWIGRSPLSHYRNELEGAVICGDQLLTDGLLARRVRGLYIECPRRRGGPGERWWPRLMRAFGELVLHSRFMLLRQDSPLLGVSVDRLEDLDPNPASAE